MGGTMDNELTQPDLIEYQIAVGFRGKIAAGAYYAGEKTVLVSYMPDDAFEYDINLPQELTTLFRVVWFDVDGETATQLRSGTYAKFQPEKDAISAINAVIQAFKLVRLRWGVALGIRSVGAIDVLLSAPFVNGDRLWLTTRKPPAPGAAYYNAAEAEREVRTSAVLARPHIGTPTFPVARRYVRCFELFDAGLYEEAIIIAHSILDDLIQRCIDDLLQKAGVNRKDREKTIRSITNDRWKVYLGPMLKDLSGKTLEEVWNDSPAALAFLNKTRNNIAHAGAAAESGTAAHCLFASVKATAALHSANLVSAEFPEGLYPKAWEMAAITIGRPVWVAAAGATEDQSFDPYVNNPPQESTAEYFRRMGDEVEAAEWEEFERRFAKLGDQRLPPGGAS